MKIIYYFALIIMGIWLFDKTCLWLERKGWLYYRFEKPQKGIIGDVLQELNAHLSPSNRHVVEMKQNTARFKKSEADAPSDPNDHFSN